MLLIIPPNNQQNSHQIICILNILETCNWWHFWAWRSSYWKIEIWTTKNASSIWQCLMRSPRARYCRPKPRNWCQRHGWISQKGRMGRIPRRMAQGTSHQGLPHMRHFCQLHSRLGLRRLPIWWKMGKNHDVLPMRIWAKIQGKYFKEKLYNVIAFYKKQGFYWFPILIVY